MKVFVTLEEIPGIGSAEQLPKFTWRFFSMAFSILLLAGSSLLISDMSAQILEQRPFLAPALSRPVRLCDHVLRRSEEQADGARNYAGVRPGDVVCIEAGARPALELRNFQGTAAAPIVFINVGGVAIISGRDDDYAGIEIYNSEHIKLSGSGVTDDCGADYPVAEQTCGIVIHGSGRGVVGAEKTRYIEIDHLEIHHTMKMGVFARSEGNGATRDIWTQYHTHVHDNYLHDIGTEGVYLGSSAYEEGIDPLLVGVEVNHNLVTDTGWDGIQVGSAVADCSIHHNRILRDSLKNQPKQHSGIMNNRGSTCHIYNNFIADGASRGIYIQGNGSNRVYNNVIVRPGQQAESKGDGIAVTTGSSHGGGILILHNTIIEPARAGIRFRNDRGTDHRIQNNLIVGAGEFVVDKASFVDIDDLTNVVVSHNLHLTSLAAARFTNPDTFDFSLRPCSPAIDSGLDSSGLYINTDFLDMTRPQGMRADAGAIEFIP